MRMCTHLVTQQEQLKEKEEKEAKEKALAKEKEEKMKLQQELSHTVKENNMPLEAFDWLRKAVMYIPSQTT